MPLPLAPTSKLEAVNEILAAALGERPVSSLTDTSGSAALAERTLDYVNRRTQTAGWHFNTEFDVPLARDPDTKHISLTNNMVKVDVSPYKYTSIDPVIRGQKLYDVKNRTYEFSQDLKAIVVYLLDFTEIPEAAREYVTIKAARIFQDRYFSDAEIAAFTREEEREALLQLKRHDGFQADYNMLGTYGAWRILGRHGGSSSFTHSNPTSDRNYMALQDTGDEIFFEIH